MTLSCISAGWEELSGHRVQCTETLSTLGSAGRRVFPGQGSRHVPAQVGLRAKSEASGTVPLASRAVRRWGVRPDSFLITCPSRTKRTAPLEEGRTGRPSSEAEWGAARRGRPGLGYLRPSWIRDTTSSNRVWPPKEVGDAWAARGALVSCRDSRLSDRKVRPSLCRSDHSATSMASPAAARLP